MIGRLYEVVVVMEVSKAIYKRAKMLHRRDFIHFLLKGIALFGVSFTALVAHTQSIKDTMMNLTHKAREIFERFFTKPETLPLAQSDSEYFANYINFAFGESFVRSKMGEREYFLIVLASLIAAGGREEFRIYIKGALNNGVNAIEIKEIIYQATAYVGFAKVYDFLVIANETFDKLGVSMPLQPQGTTTQENRQHKGRAVQNMIFGEANITKMIESTPTDKAFINDFLSANCFGDYYTRNGVDIKTRELITLVYLIALGGVDSQVKAHIQGNLNMGQTRESLLGVIMALVPYIGYPKSLNALFALDEITKTS